MKFWKVLFNIGIALFSVDIATILLSVYFGNQIGLNAGSICLIGPPALMVLSLAWGITFDKEEQENLRREKVKV